MLAEVRDIVKRRNRFVEGENSDADISAIFDKFMSAFMAKNDMSSKDYRRSILELKDDQGFYLALMGSDQPKITSYLAFEFPQYFKRNDANRKLVARILRSTYGSAEQTQLMEKLHDAAPDLAQDLVSLLRDRDNFKHGRELSIDSYSVPADPNYPEQGNSPREAPVQNGVPAPNAPPAPAGNEDKQPNNWGRGRNADSGPILRVR